MIERQESKFRVKFTDDKSKRSSKNKEPNENNEDSHTEQVTTTHVFSGETPISESQVSERSNLNKQFKFKNTLQRMEYLKLSSVSTIMENVAMLGQFFDYHAQFKLLFRASNHNFDVKDFHQICDSYQNTLILCLTEDNKIIGGFTPLTWEDKFDENRTHFKTDFKNKTFLFSVSNKQKYPLVKSLKNKAICCFKAYGPTFGGGYDLMIGDGANYSPNAVSYFPRNFLHNNINGGNKRDFTGTSRKNFKLVEWQVFQVHQTGRFQSAIEKQPQKFIEQKTQGNHMTLGKMKSMVAKIFTGMFGKSQ